MRMKQTLALLLAAITISGFLVFPVSAAAPVSVFYDVTDVKLADAVETLRLLGIVGGTGRGNFEPNRVLTRAEFCKMAVEAMGNGDKVAAQMNRTIFRDVPSTHWARGYINVATQGSSSSTANADAEKPPVTTTTNAIIRGDAYGNFNPDRPITYAEAVTILMRILTYTDTDVGVVWPQGYLSAAETAGLTDGVVLKAGDTLTRSQAALMFQNLLFAHIKGTITPHFTRLECTISKDPVIILAVNASGTDGSNNAVTTSGGGSYSTERSPFNDDLVGRRAKLLLDKESHLLAIQPSEQGTQRVVGVLSLTYNALKATGGEEIKVPDADTTVWLDGVEKKYSAVYLAGVKSGTQAVLQYNVAGKLDYIFIRDTATTSQDQALVAKNKPTGTGNPFGSLAIGQKDYQLYKNGVPATVADMRQYDVATYDKNAKAMYVSDQRLTGIYENVYPNRETPATLTMMGATFTVLSSAIPDLSSFKIGDTVTLLLTYDGRVAGAVDTNTARSTTVGVVKIDKTSGDATVTPLVKNAGGPTFTLSGGTSYTGVRAEEIDGQLVTVSSGAVKRLSLSRLTAGSSGASAPLDVTSRRIGTLALSENVVLYERVANSRMAPVKLEDITRGIVPTDQIIYIHRDFAGKADIVVLEDATGDLYDYGFVQYVAATSSGNDINDSFTNANVSVKNLASPNGSAKLECGIQIKNNAAGGIVPRSGSNSLAAYVELEAIGNIRSSAFDVDKKLVTTNSAIYSIANNVQCYNSTTKTWFSVPDKATTEDFMSALNVARAFSDTVTIYVDKAPDLGGKIRLVVVG